MTEKNAGGLLRRLATRVLAAGALLVVYCISTVAVSSIAAFTTGVTTAQAQRGGRGGRGGGRGRGPVRGRGRGRGRGYFRGGIWVPSVWCHQPWSSRRVYCGW